MSRGGVDDEGWSMRAVAVPLLVALLLAPAACGTLPPGGGPAAPTLAPVVGVDGVIRVRFDHRADAGAAPVVVVPRGGTVELVVGSPTAERVLVSGLDQVRYVTAGGTVVVRFVAGVVGPMTVSLAGSGIVLGTIDVR